jgi:hypothetical protein
MDISAETLKTCTCMQVHGKKAVVNFRLYADDVVREPKNRGVSSGSAAVSADTSVPSLGNPLNFLQVSPDTFHRAVL